MKSKSLSHIITTFAAAILLMISAASCHHVDNKRLPLSAVNIVFWTEGDWVTWGVTGAAQSRRFIRQDRVPANFPYTVSTYTGFGGVLLCTTYAGEPVAYDLACPVECNSQIRVAVTEDMVAECPKCHSTYDIFSLYGHPLSGPAATDGFGLQLYRVGPGPSGEAYVVTR